MGLSKLQQRFILLLAVSLLAIGKNISLLAAQTNAPGKSLRIGIIVQNNAGVPLNHLSARDFVLSNQGIVLPFRLVRPALSPTSPTGAYEPTRMLILLSSHIPNPASALNLLLPALDPVWQHGWQVAAVLSNGNKTPYATSSEELKQFWVIAAGNRAQPEAVISAIKDLDSFAGRRLVLYLAESTNKEAMPPQKILAAAKEAMAQTFVVNGGALAPSGDSEPNYGGGISTPLGGSQGFAAAAESNPSPIPIGGGPSFGFTRISKQYDPGIYLAINTRAAIRQAMRSAQGYYGLRIRRASLQTLPPGTPLSLQIHLRRGTDYTVMAMAYGKNNPPPIVLSKK